MSEYISEELIRQTLRDATGTEVEGELLSTVLEVKSQVEKEHPDYPDYTEVNDLVKGMRAWWVTERALNLLDTKYQQLANRREQMIAQEMGLDSSVQQPTQYQQQPTQQPTVSIWYLLAGIAGAVVLGVLVGYALAWFHSQGSEDDNGRDG